MRAPGTPDAPHHPPRRPTNAQFASNARPLPAARVELASVNWGITTSRAHVDPLDPVVYPLEPSDREIDWFAVHEWLREADSSTPPAAFAGRYFLGAATEAEGEAGTGFCLWAHGEASSLDSPPRIVPLQRADPARQTTTGDDGKFFGFQDATALASQLDRCLAVGDLTIVETKQILVFLEVADGTPLSTDYWAAWASTVHDAMLCPARLADRTGAEMVQPLVPAVLCAFAFDDETQTFLPEPGVRECLDRLGPPGYRTRCYGLWARRLPGDKGLESHTFSWSNVGEYRQPITVLGFDLPQRQRVPVRYLRWFDGPEGLPIPQGHLHDTLSLLTIEWAATEEDDDPLGATFMATDWRADRRDDDGLLLELPSQLGIDMSAQATEASAACLGRTQVVVKWLPYLVEGMPVDLHGPCAFAIRYYRPRAAGTPLTRAESLALSGNGVQTAAVWQGFADLDHGWEPYVEDLIAPFVNEEGRAHGLEAFTYAADIIQQPPYTPIYFAVDFPVDEPRYTDGQPGTVPVRTPPLATILTYFSDVHSGYREYLTTHAETPYYVGVYANSDTAAALYRAGLASHFWQPPWGEAGPFPHLNAWQIAMYESVDPDPQVAPDNPALQRCAPPALRGGDFWVDIDCAWGDPGGFSVR